MKKSLEKNFKRKKIVVVGGGITGLSTAYFLQQFNKFDITIVEASKEFGGKIKTINEDGFIIEAGPDSFISTKPEAVRLIKKLGYAHNLINPLNNKYFIYFNRKLNSLPKGFVSMVPTQVVPFLTDTLFTFSGKCRVLLEPFIPKRKKITDESLAAFFGRRFGKEYVTKVAAPLFAGIHAANPDELSILSTLPHFRKMEQHHGSITKAVKQTLKTKVRNTESVFLSLKGGIHKLVEYLIYKLKYVNKFNEVLVNDIQTIGREYELKLSTGKTLLTEYVIFTTPAYITASILNRLNNKASKLLGDIPFASTVIVTLAISKKNIKHVMDATGFIIPENESIQMTACTWTSSKWQHRAPQEYVLIRCYYGKYKNDQVLKLTDEELIQLATKELKPIIDWNGELHKSWIFRWTNGLPQYLVGHQRKVKQIEKSLKSTPNIFLAGASYYGVGLPDCIKQGEKVAGLVAAIEKKQTKKSPPSAVSKLKK